MAITVELAHDRTLDSHNLPNIALVEVISSVTPQRISCLCSTTIHEVDVALAQLLLVLLGNNLKAG